MHQLELSILSLRMLVSIRIENEKSNKDKKKAVHCEPPNWGDAIIRGRT